MRLDNLDQRGGGVISVQTARRGASSTRSSSASRSPAAGWPAARASAAPRASAATPRPRPTATAGPRRDHLRRGRHDRGSTATASPMARPTSRRARSTFPAGEAQVVFGLRHAPAGGNRMLAGTIVRARLYDRALDPAEVAASAGRVRRLRRPRGDRRGPARRPPRGARRGSSREIERLRSSSARPSRTRPTPSSPREPAATHVQLRGNPAQPGEVVSAGGVAAVAGPDADFGLPPDAPEAERRERLAAWITDPRNPLFARVIVNRLWQAHFGAGLVETPSDLGFNGGRPVAPRAARLAGLRAGRAAAGASRRCTG